MDGTSSATASATSSLDGRGAGSGGSSDFLNLSMFGQPSGVSDLLLGGASGFGGLGNGYGNDSGTSSKMSSGVSGSSTFDLNDFPSLGGGTGSGGGSSATSNGLTAALRQQQHLLAQQQMLQGTKSSNSPNLYRLAMQSGVNGGQNFTIATEDFPALPGTPVGGSSGGSGALSRPGDSSLLLGGNGSVGVSLSGTGSQFGNPVSRTSSSGSGLYGGDLDSGTQLDANGLLGGVGLSGLGGLSGLPFGSSQGSSLLHQRSSAPSSVAPGSGAVGSSSGTGGGSSGAGSALTSDFGLLGLLGVIRMTDADRNALALGKDLTMLGMNLSPGEKLYPNFASPFSETPATKEPHYQLPTCYYMQTPPLKTGHLSKFQLETLFYVFYAMPKDVLQAYAAQELYARDWRYHGELRRWFQRGGPGDGNPSTGGPQFLYFDINTWERRVFTGNYQNIANGFLTEDDVRVKMSNS